MTRRGEELRTFRTLPIGRKRVTLTLPVARVECAACDAVRQVSIAFADPRRTYTKSFARYALELSQRMTIRDVANHLGVGWDLIKEIQKADLQRRFKKVKLKKLRQLAIDEISIGKRHRYLTVVLDLKSGAVVFVGEGKGGEALEPFWRRFRASRAKIQAVAMDMSPAYIKAVSEQLPKAQIVFDHFHIIKLFNEKLSDLRRELFREATDKLHKHVLKGTRWLLLMNPEHDLGLGQLLADRLDVGGRHVHGHRLDFGPRSAQSPPERLQRLAAFALADKHYGPALQIQDDRQVAVASADRDLVDGQLSQFLQLHLLESSLQIGLLDFLDQVPTHAQMIRHVPNRHALRQFQHIAGKGLGVGASGVGKGDGHLPDGVAGRASTRATGSVSVTACGRLAGCDGPQLLAATCHLRRVTQRTRRLRGCSIENHTSPST